MHPRRSACTNVCKANVNALGAHQEADWFAKRASETDFRTAKMLALAQAHGVSEMRTTIETQLSFSQLPTVMVGSCCMAALLGVDLWSGPHAAVLPLLKQSITGLLGASSLSSLFTLVHANTLLAGLSYSGQGISALEYVHRHGWRFGTIVWSTVATQAFASSGLLLYMWAPILSASVLPTATECASAAFLSAIALLGVAKHSFLFYSLRGEVKQDEVLHTSATAPKMIAEAGEIWHLVNVPGTPPSGAFSRATVHNRVVYVSGTGASNDTATGAVLTDGTAYAETRGALDNVATILHGAGSAPESIVVATMLLTDKSDYAECNRAYVDWFAERGLAKKLPARSSALWAVPTTAKVADRKSVV